MNSKKKISICLTVCMLMMLAKNVYAYQCDSQSWTNKSSVGHNDSHVEEDYPPPDPIVPGEDKLIAKKVMVQNDNTVSCFVRASIAYSDQDIGKAVTLQNLDSENWIYLSAEEDPELGGYYYYVRVLKPGEKTTALFDGVLVAGAVADFHYQTEKNEFEIIVYEESVEQGTHENYQDAWHDYIGQV